MASPGKGSEQDVVIANITTINSNVLNLSKGVDKIGGSSDSKILREQLKQRREETQQLIQETKELLQKGYAPSEKLKHDKLSKQFNDIVEEFKKVIKMYLQKERGSIPCMIPIGPQQSNKLAEGTLILFK